MTYSPQPCHVGSIILAPLDGAAEPREEREFARGHIPVNGRIWIKKCPDSIQDIWPLVCVFLTHLCVPGVSK